MNCQKEKKIIQLKAREIKKVQYTKYKYQNQETQKKG